MSGQFLYFYLFFDTKRSCRRIYFLAGCRVCSKHALKTARVFSLVLSVESVEKRHVLVNSALQSIGVRSNGGLFFFCFFFAKSSCDCWNLRTACGVDRCHVVRTLNYRTMWKWLSVHTYIVRRLCVCCLPVLMLPLHVKCVHAASPHLPADQLTVYRFRIVFPSILIIGPRSLLLPLPCAVSNLVPCPYCATRWAFVDLTSGRRTDE